MRVTAPTGEYVDVPPDDYHAIRGAILSLRPFYRRLEENAP
jgi:hypothetical protein